ncbi:unnamed protein product [Aspergillus oryzae]|uniref:E3 ubiquitin ligase complex SCF subunit n=2 Tax=Aspergillus oryzae TaxID=5062 RepID=A0AAN4YW19_ASPOZ|nr:unnamed protein product [Aspergillus oryzae]GMF92506.1 unnamed protein product [Aspergillus oryzae]GMG03233.1 unnamed protein product [Aspergillus oryzae]GMG36023.1 unnamed protein product [Aspergillus oryzae]GMG46229.1 unnamed protein product [Aspergillus oryzae var. brunneus]
MATPTLTFTSSDGVDIPVGSRFGADLLSRHLERDVAERSQLIKNMLEDLGETGEPIPIPNVSHLGSAMRLTFQSTLHDGNSLTRCSTGDDDDSRRKTTDIDEWDQKFMQVDQEMLFEIILTVANMIKGKSPEEIRKTFNIQNDFTPEEEDQIRRENEWAEE